MSELEALLDRVVEGSGGDEALDLDLARALNPFVIVSRRNLARDGNEPHTYWRYTSKVDDAAALVTKCLPGWWWKVGTCCVSDDACIAPDYNNPAHSERLHQEFPLDKLPEEFDAGFDVDRRPPGNVARALLESLLLALIAIEQHPSPAFNPR